MPHWATKYGSPFSRRMHSDICPRSLVLESKGVFSFETTQLSLYWPESVGRGRGKKKKKTFYRDLGSKMWKGGMFMRKERNTCLWMRITYTEKSDKVTSPLKTNLGNRLPQNSGSPNPFSTFKGWLCNSQNSSDENVLVVKYWRFGFGYFLSTLCVIQDIQLIIMKTWLKT